ncbi:hypothetical protein PAPYR_7954 [Paratrimastix pyriformis]|uniref:SAP domain-containing protein n=1 Tax=Paratrimastix pyriformis TaxID=342808 RepID=A0ABQ8UHC8_9EUKA|nr:hypothetical protein PAPYR_7954 [Paratrimastix pyriformis]
MLVLSSRAQPGAHPEPIFRLLVQDLEARGFWLFLEMKSSEALAQLDHYLRAIWLDCCGHLSDFTSAGLGSHSYSKSQTVARIFAPGRKFVHTYDFGTPSETEILVLEVHNGRTVGDNPITLLARNKAPVYPCQAEGCHEVATNLCDRCSEEQDLPNGAFCDAHSDDHGDCEGELLPLCNSPRTGICGYSGPADPPYGPGRTAFAGFLDEPSEENHGDEDDDEDGQMNTMESLAQAMLLPRVHAAYSLIGRRQSRTRPRREAPTTDAGWRQADADGSLGCYNVDQLKVFLRAKHLRLSGHKADLVARIHSYFATHGEEATAAAGTGGAIDPGPSAVPLAAGCAQAGLGASHQPLKPLETDTTPLVCLKMRFSVLLLALLALTLGQAMEDISVRWSQPNGAFFLQTTSGIPNPRVQNLDTVSGLSTAYCKSPAGPIELDFVSAEAAEQFAQALFPGMPFSSQRRCEDGSDFNIVYTTDLVVEKDHISFQATRATLKDLFITSSVSFVAVRPATLMSIYTNNTTTEEAEVANFPLVKRVFQQNGLPDILRRFLETGLLPDQEAAAMANQYDNDWPIGSKSWNYNPSTGGCLKKINLYGAPGGTIYVSADAWATLNADVSFSFDTSWGRPAYAQVIVSGHLKARALLDIELQKQWSWSFRQALAKVSLINPAPSFSIAFITFHLDLLVEFGVGGSLSFDGRAEVTAGVQVAGDVSLGLRWAKEAGVTYPRSASLTATPIGPTLAGSADTSARLYVYARPLFLVGDADAPWASGHVELRVFAQADGSYRYSGGVCTASQVKTVVTAGAIFDASYYVKWFTDGEQAIEPITLKTWKLYDGCVKLPYLLTDSPASAAVDDLLVHIMPVFDGPVMGAAVARTGPAEAASVLVDPVPSVLPLPPLADPSPAADSPLYAQAISHGLLDVESLAADLRVPSDAPQFTFYPEHPFNWTAATVQWTPARSGDYALTAAIRAGSVPAGAQSRLVMMQVGDVYRGTADPERASLRLTGLTAGTPMAIHVSTSRPAEWPVDLVAVPITADTQDTIYVDPIGGSEDLADPTLGTAGLPFRNLDDAYASVFPLPTNTLYIGAYSPNPLWISSLTGALGGYGSAEDTRVDAVFSSRLLFISRATVNVAGLTFTHGHVTGEDGGAVFLHSTTAVFTNCIFDDKLALEFLARTFLLSDGAVFLHSSTAVFTNCIFAN